jgi:X-domain of DnaJ-containing
MTCDSTPASSATSSNSGDGPPPYVHSPRATRPSVEERNLAPGNNSNNDRLAQQWAWAYSEYCRVAEEKVVQNTSKLIERLRPYVESEYAGDPDDPATVAFINKVKGEAEELKKERFGAEVSPTDAI